MTIDLIHQHKVRIDLTSDELSAFHVSYRQLSADDLQTRIMIGKLLSTAYNEVGFDHKDKKLFIETYPHSDGGCILYVTVLRSEGKKSARKNSDLPFPPVILTTADANLLCRICSCLHQKFNDKLLHSSLFLDSTRYCLAVVCTAVAPDDWRQFTKEWDCPIVSGRSELLRIQEHGKLLIPAGAVDVLARC